MTSFDPIHAVLARWRAADTAYQSAQARAHAKWPADPARAEEVANRATWTARDAALDALYATQPTTLAGLAALAAVFCDEDLDAVFNAGQASSGLRTILRAVQHLALDQAYVHLLEGVLPPAATRANRLTCALSA